MYDINRMYHILVLFRNVLYILSECGDELIECELKCIVEMLRRVENIIIKNSSFDRNICQKISNFIKYILFTHYYADVPYELLDNIRKAKTKLNSQLKDGVKINNEDIQRFNNNLRKHEEIYDDMITIHF